MTCRGRRPLALVVTGGQRNDGAALETVLAGIRIPGLHVGRARPRPEAVIAGRAYSAAARRAMLHKRGITVVIPQKSEQMAAPQEARAQRRATSGAGRRRGCGALAVPAQGCAEFGQRAGALKQRRGVIKRGHRFAKEGKAFVSAAGQPGGAQRDPEGTRRAEQPHVGEFGVGQLARVSGGVVCLGARVTSRPRASSWRIWLRILRCLSMWVS